MNFNYGMNFNVRAAKVEQKKPEEGEKGKEEKPEKATSPKAAPETVVLTGNATEIQAAINKATVHGAMGVNNLQQIRDGGLETKLEEYAQLKTHYLEIESQLNDQEKSTYLQELNGKIENIINEYQDILGDDVSQELNDDYTQWATELSQIKGCDDPNYPSDLMDALFYDLENIPHYLNPQFVYNVMEPGVGRVNYFRARVNEYQGALRYMDQVAERYWGNNSINQSNPKVIQFNQWKQHFQQKLTEAQQYYELAKNDLPSAGDQIHTAEQNKIER